MSEDGNIRYTTMPDQNPVLSVSIIHDLVFHLIDLVFTIIIDKLDQ